MTVFSRVFEELENNRRKIMNDTNTALDAMENFKRVPKEDTQRKDEFIKEIEDKLREILATVSR